MSKYIFIFLLMSFSCAQSGKQEAIELRTPQAIADQLKSNSEIVVIDVRTPEELQSGFIAGAVNLNYNSPSFQQSLDSLDLSRTYLVYCAVGKRSDKAQKMMKEKGFEHILSIDGGLNAWVAAGLPVRKP